MPTGDFMCEHKIWANLCGICNTPQLKFGEKNLQEKLNTKYVAIGGHFQELLDKYERELKEAESHGRKNILRIKRNQIKELQLWLSNLDSQSSAGQGIGQNQIPLL